jgi:hypothetical protein
LAARIPGSGNERQPSYGVSVRETLAELELTDAVILAVWLWVTVGERARKRAISAPSGIVTNGGTHSSEVFEDSDTVTPAAALTGALSFTVQNQSQFNSGYGRVQEREAMPTDKRLRVAVWETPFNVAFRVAVWLLVMVPAVTVKGAEAAPAGTVTEVEGTGRSWLLLAIDTVMPPAGAGLLSLTVHVVTPSESRLLVLHVRELSSGASRLSVAVWGTPAGTAADAWSE